MDEYAPLWTLLDAREVRDLLTVRQRAAMSPSRQITYLLPQSAEATRWAVKWLSAHQDELLAVLEGAFGSEMLFQVVLEALGTALDSVVQLRELEAGDLLHVLGAGLRAQAGANDIEAWEAALHSALTVRGGPFVDRAKAEQAFEELLEGHPEDEGVRYTPRVDPGTAGAADICSQAGNERLILTGREEQWTGLHILRGATNLKLVDFTDAHFQTFTSRQSAERWLITRMRRWPGDAALSSSARGLGEVRWQTHTANEIEQIVVRTAPHASRDELKALGMPPLFSYRRAETLRRRATALGIQGRSKLNPEDLRLAVAEEACRQRPLSFLLGGRPGGFVRNASADGEPEALLRDHTSLESLHCHSRGCGIVHVGLEPLPHRLQGTIPGREVYCPRSPFL